MATPATEAILFDFGGVIWDMRWDVSRALEGEHGLAQGTIFTSLYGSEAWRAVQCGQGDREAWLAGAHGSLERSAGRSLPPLHEAWRTAQGPIHANIDLVRSLRPRYRVGLLSNADHTLRERLENGLGIASLFDDIVCSAEVAVAKPSPEIYVLAARRLGVAPSACVFVDDHEPNVRAAEAVGMRGVVFRVDRGDDLRLQLCELGIVVPAP